MDSNSNNTKSIKRKVVDQLVEGYEFATQLQLLLSHQQYSNHHIDQNRLVSASGSPDPVDELLAKILGSFHKTISVLDTFDPVAVSVPIPVEGSWNASCGDDSAAPASCNGGDSGDSKKKRLGVGKGKRGCYTRKKRSHTRVVEARSFEDRYAWRKYGQKEILNTTFPRSYFRCTHKPTQGCKATKLVQKLEQDPEMFQITYIGYHTCTANDQTQAKVEPIDNEIMMDSDKTVAATTAQNQVNAKIQEQDNNISSVTVVSTVKEEEKNNGDLYKKYCEGSSTDGDLSLVWQDMMMFDDHQNQYYCGEISTTTSHHFGFVDNDQFSSFYDSYCA
ncbi:PREDICTED: probable WRKY transcription factor 54 [Camelina sativa]|uniref:Probable WRKY transcription factor 54 n=1 Tax=Camelina sativa TaxID=90675 RepID=A0ABM1RQE1_CAMSA|nr:PREDICTED: probable WRKY transcription factor 54 [Camelina sativa]